MLLVLVCEGEEKFLHKGLGGDTEIPGERVEAAKRWASLGKRQLGVTRGA